LANAMRPGILPGLILKFPLTAELSRRNILLPVVDAIDAKAHKLVHAKRIAWKAHERREICTMFASSSVGGGEQRSFFLGRSRYRALEDPLLRDRSLVSGGRGSRVAKGQAHRANDQQKGERRAWASESCSTFLMAHPE